MASVHCLHNNDNDNDDNDDDDNDNRAHLAARREVLVDDHLPVQQRAVVRRPDPRPCELII